MNATIASGVVAVLVAVGGIKAEAGDPDRGPSSELILVGRLGEAMSVAGHLLPEGRPTLAVSADPKFFCILKVEGVVAGQAPWGVGSELVLLFHSPAQAFVGEDPAGRRCRFRFEVRKTAAGDAAYVLREARLEPAPP